MNQNHDGKKPGVMVPIPQYPLYSATIAEYGMEQAWFETPTGNVPDFNLSSSLRIRRPIFCLVFLTQGHILYRLVTFWMRTTIGPWIFPTWKEPSTRRENTATPVSLSSLIPVIRPARFSLRKTFVRLSGLPRRKASSSWPMRFVVSDRIFFTCSDAHFLLKFIELSIVLNYFVDCFILLNDFWVDFLYFRVIDWLTDWSIDWSIEVKYYKILNNA